MKYEMKMMRLFAALLMTTALFTACKKGNAPSGDATVAVTVRAEDGALLANVPVKLYDEKSYEMFEKDNLTPPVTSLLTGPDGTAVFLLEQKVWFATDKTRFLTFVVQQGGGPDNYEIWSSGRTVEAGKTVRIELRLQHAPS